MGEAQQNALMGIHVAPQVATSLVEVLPTSKESATSLQTSLIATPLSLDTSYVNNCTQANPEHNGEYNISVFGETQNRTPSENKMDPQIVHLSTHTQNIDAEAQADVEVSQDKHLPGSTPQNQKAIHQQLGPHSTDPANVMSLDIEAQAVFILNQQTHSLHRPQMPLNSTTLFANNQQERQAQSPSRPLPGIFQFTQPQNPYSNLFIGYFLALNLFCIVAGLALGEYYFLFETNNLGNLTVLYPILGVALVLGVLSGAPSMG